MKLPSIIVIGLLAAVSACQDNTFKKFTPPNIAFSTADKPTPQHHFVDSLKNQFKDAFLGKTYAFNIFVLDPENAGVSALKYDLSSEPSSTEPGTLTHNGAFISNGCAVTGVVSGRNTIFQFKPNASPAVYKLSFRGMNRYGVVGDPYILTLVVFNNIPPVANFIVQPGNDGNYSRLLNASASKDGDEKFGGRIQTFQYTITRIATESQGCSPLSRVRSYPYITSNTTPVVFPGPGSYSIELIVYDNDGQPSPPFIQTELVK